MATVVIHYSEIALKGKNRAFFEKILINNIKESLKTKLISVEKGPGRILLDVKDETVKPLLEKIPGIANFSFAIETKQDLNELNKISLNILKNKTFSSFKIETKRSNKNFMNSSMEINEKVGEHIVQKLKKDVKLKDPDATLHIEIGNKNAFIYLDKHKGIGGLPVGASGKLICSLSGGIDSPVSSYLMMKRGCRIIFVHIYNKSQVNQGLLDKIKNLVKELSQFQLTSKLYIVPFEKIQKQIMMNVTSKLRMIIYRRFMLKIINQIARKERIDGIVTGDSVGQVASQTVENLKCIYDASVLPIYSPLIGMNKEEIMNLARKIGTYDISIKPYPDCCSFMIAKHPETKGNLYIIKKAEALIKNQETLIKEAVDMSEIYPQSI